MSNSISKSKSTFQISNKPISRKIIHILLIILVFSIIGLFGYIIFTQTKNRVNFDNVDIPIITKSMTNKTNDKIYPGGSPTFNPDSNKCNNRDNLPSICMNYESCC